MVSNTRMYGAAIALVSGVYSLWSAATVSEMDAGAWIMLVLGIVVVVHGTLLPTDAGDRLGNANGPLMIGYGLLMLLNQALLGVGMLGDGMSMGDGMGMGDGMAGSPLTAGMGWDAGMVALALLMLVSGAIMTRGGGMTGDGSEM